MRKIVMLLAVLLGTTFMANANTINRKAATAKEVKTKVIRKHKRAKKVAAKTTSTAKPVAAPAKK
ncbi:hypothetical protein [Flavobacterium phycosphaerae]|uniref:hypothetical protein n=1 Tax=Flavobacterium phycosphaerae TaxID=2697515 RepID=UPI001389D569|nr:hypothetical protein [Flavobacterium phycosphaerae]